MRNAIAVQKELTASWEAAQKAAAAFGHNPSWDNLLYELPWLWAFWNEGVEHGKKSK